MKPMPTGKDRMIERALAALVVLPPEEGLTRQGLDDLVRQSIRDHHGCPPASLSRQDRLSYLRHRRTSYDLLWRTLQRKLIWTRDLHDVLRSGTDALIAEAYGDLLGGRWRYGG
jgi:hypothetical protein